MHWSAPYVGTPYIDHGRAEDGCDCWGLVRLAFAREKHILLPSYANVSPQELSEIAAMVRGEVETGIWRKVSEAGPFDVAVFRRAQYDSHVGLMVDDVHMLHSDKHAGGARIERMDGGRWKTQFAGFFRHKDLI